MKSSIYSSIICVALATTMASCQYKDFDEYDGTVPVKVVVDYSHSGCKEVPAMSRVLFFQLGGQGSPYIYDIKDSAIINLPDGYMQAFAYNNNSLVNRFSYSGGTMFTPVMLTDKADSRGIFPVDEADNTIYFDYPDKTCTAWKLVAITGNEKTSDEGSNRIVLTMKDVTRPVTIEVRGIRNASFLQSVRMSLSGLHREYSPVEIYSHSDVSIVSDGKIITTDPDRGNRSVFDDKTVIDTLRSTMDVYGVGNGQSTLTVFLDGGNWHKVLTFDVTDQLQSQAAGTAPITIIVETTYNVKDDVPVEGGFDVGFNDWDDVQLPINMD